LCRTREQGYGEVVNPCNNGVAAVAVPVLGLDGQPVLAVACSGPASRLTVRRRQDLRRRLQQTALSMHEALTGKTAAPATGA
jgi:DNA-binding IclR family transcriptional regulator